MSKKLQRQIDLEVSGLHVREAAEGEGRSRTIEGHAAVFGQRRSSASRLAHAPSTLTGDSATFSITASPSAVLNEARP